MYTVPVDEPFSGDDRCHCSPSSVGEAIWRVAYVGFATICARGETGKGHAYPAGHQAGHAALTLTPPRGEGTRLEVSVAKW
jgi:hypothetical protein